MGAARSDPFYGHCRDLPGVTEDVKWGDNLVFSVGKKMFAVFQLPDGEPLSMKVDGETFALLTQRPGIEPAPYLARHGWILLTRRDVMPREPVEALLTEAHILVAAKLPKKVRADFGIVV